MLYYRRNVYVLSLAVFLASVSWNQIVPFFPLLIKQMGVQGNALLIWVGVVCAAQSVAAIIAMPFWGKMGDRHGRKPMTIRAGFCLAGIYLGMSLCRTPWQLASFRFLNGALTGFVPSSMALIATNTPEELAPQSVATAQTASNAGLIIGPAIGGLLASYIGYSGSMQVSGTAVLVSTLMVWWLVREPNKVSLAEKTSLLQDFAKSIRSPIQISIMFALMLSWAFGAAINPYLLLHLKTLGGAQPTWLTRDVFSGAVFSLPAVSFVLCAQRWTSAGGRWGYDRTILIGLAGGAVGALLLGFAQSIWAFAVLYLVTGVWLAAISPSVAAVTCTKVEESFRGRAYGIQQSAGTIGALIAPIIASAVGALFGVRAIFIFVGLMFLSGSLVFRQLAARWNGSARGLAPLDRAEAAVRQLWSDDR